jgi:hypothetical protein
MKTAISLHEYRLAAPNTDRVPTITQMGLIGPILLREYRKRVRTARRRAAAERLQAATASALRWIWRQLTSAHTVAAHPVHRVQNLKPSNVDR